MADKPTIECAEAPPVDEVAATELAEEFMGSIKRHYLSRPRSPAAVYEVLNALAAAAGGVLAQCEDSALDWFGEAVALGIEAAKEEARG